MIQYEFSICFPFFFFKKVVNQNKKHKFNSFERRLNGNSRVVCKCGILTNNLKNELKSLKIPLDYFEEILIFIIPPSFNCHNPYSHKNHCCISHLLWPVDVESNEMQISYQNIINYPCLVQIRQSFVFCFCPSLKFCNFLVFILTDFFLFVDIAKATSRANNNEKQKF